MKVDVILGNNIDTYFWISKLRDNFSENILVIDYDYHGKPFVKNGIRFYSVIDARTFLQRFETLNYYKSIYIYPSISEEKSSINNDTD